MNTHETLAAKLNFALTNLNESIIKETENLLIGKGIEIRPNGADPKTKKAIQQLYNETMIRATLKHINIETREELLEIIFNEFSESEIRNINPKIYLNPEHSENYYTNFHLGEYNKCLDYLFEHRNLLQ